VRHCIQNKDLLCCARALVTQETFCNSHTGDMLGNFPIIENIGTRFSTIGKGTVKVWVTFSQCWVQFGK